jgi:hypothetical protein
MENNEIIGFVPWPLAAATAVWFGVMAYKSAKNIVLWAIGGGVLGLVLTTLAMGLGQATFIPYHTGEIAAFRLKLAAASVIVVLCAGWLFTGSLHRRLLAAWRKNAEAAPEAPAKPPAPAPKQS